MEMAELGATADWGCFFVLPALVATATTARVTANRVTINNRARFMGLILSGFGQPRGVTCGAQGPSTEGSL